MKTDSLLNYTGLKHKSGCRNRHILGMEKIDFRIFYLVCTYLLRYSMLLRFMVSIKQISLTYARNVTKISDTRKNNKKGNLNLKHL
jgi:hypothetical protein